MVDSTNEFGALVHVFDTC